MLSQDWWSNDSNSTLLRFSHLPDAPALPPSHFIQYKKAWSLLKAMMSSLQWHFTATRRCILTHLKKSELLDAVCQQSRLPWGPLFRTCKPKCELILLRFYSFYKLRMVVTFKHEIILLVKITPFILQVICGHFFDTKLLYNAISSLSIFYASLYFGEGDWIDKIEVAQPSLGRKVWFEKKLYWKKWAYITYGFQSCNLSI